LSRMVAFSDCGSHIPITPFIRRNRLRPCQMLEIKKGPNGRSGPGVWDVVIVSSRGQLTPILGGSQWGGYCGADTVDISAFKLRRAHIPIIPFLRTWTNRL
jgi:hypothetical protein